ncbi:MAG: DNA polymerase III subunit chi [Holosporaceae bacterium]|jgi:DNA polymerase-3 subunit chi|nr:DNA polymerase III subunit chi [Holosporaceae bacterium]
MEINFYHVSQGNLVPSSLRLLEKIYSSGQRCVFFSPDEERVKIIDKALWTFSTNAFIPHGDMNFGFSDRQPIYFTNRIENPNNANVLMMIDTIDYKEHHNFKRIIIVFEEKQQAENANALYNDLKKNNVNVNYWKQNPKGWEKLN